MSQSNLDRDDIRTAVSEWIKCGETNASIVRLVGQHFDVTTSEKSVRRFRKRYSLQPRGFEPDWTQVDGDRGEVSITTVQVIQDPDTMLRQRGLDPEEWIIDSGLRVNEYQGPASAEHAEKTGENKITYFQTRFSVTRKNPESQIVAARSDGWAAPPRKARSLGAIPRLVVVVGDQQAPFQDPALHRCFLQWLEENKPHEGVSLGDSVDYPEPSRHPDDPENTASINECNQSGYDLFRGYVNSSPDTEWTKLPGNHDERIRNLTLKPKVRSLYGVKRAQLLDGPKEPSVLNIEFLLRLDELGIKYIDPHGKYDLAEHRLSDKLAVRHGWIARQGSGASALETLKHTGYSIIIGHTHRQSMVEKTIYDIDEYPKVLTAVETGCMCRLDTEVNADGRYWPNYSPLPDWQQGFATAVVWPDGKFKIDLATYVNGELLWRDQRYTA